MTKRIILTSFGLTNSLGRNLIAKALQDVDLTNKKIFLFHEPHYSIEGMLRRACISIGFKPENILLSGEQLNNEEIMNTDYLYITEGNTFEVLALLRERGLDSVFAQAFKNGASYIGASAGAMIAGVSIEEAYTFDKNFVGMTDFRGLSLFDGIVLPHHNKSEAKRYIENSPGIENKYKEIVSVADDKMIVLEVS